MIYLVIIFVVVFFEMITAESESTSKDNILIIEAHYLTSFFLLHNGFVLSGFSTHEVTFIHRITAYSICGLKRSQQ